MKTLFPGLGVLLIFWVLSASAAIGQTRDSKLMTMDSWAEARGWEGVGLLLIERRSSCTGVLVRPDLVMTAAHCLVDPDTGAKADPRQVEFRAGWRNGKSIAMRRGVAALIHPNYLGGSEVNGKQLRYDMALIRLEAPIQSTHANPFRVGGNVHTGNEVSVVSYGKGRNNAPSRQRVCTVLQATDGMVAMSCDVIFGSSGAPVFRMENGRPVIVSLVSAIGDVNGEKVSFGMDIARPLKELMRDLRAGRGVYPPVSFGAKRIGIGEGRSSGGARFLKP